MLKQRPFKVAKCDGERSGVPDGHATRKADPGRWAAVPSLKPPGVSQTLARACISLLNLRVPSRTSFRTSSTRIASSGPARRGRRLHLLNSAR